MKYLTALSDAKQNIFQPPPPKKRFCFRTQTDSLSQLVQQTSICQIQRAHSIAYGQNLGAVIGCTFALFFNESTSVTVH